MSSNRPFLNVSKNISHSPVRATFIPTKDGLKLVRVSEFSSPKFLRDGWELQKVIKEADSIEKIDDEALTYIPEAYLEGIEFEANASGDPEAAARFHAINQKRARRRARQRALDLIMCNPDLDTFATFTYAPDDDLDRVSYAECYGVLKPWLSNRVSRNGLKYVCATERQRSDGIHFHMLANSEALKLGQARSPYTGKPLKHNGKPLYNVLDWRHGFTSAENVSGEDANTKVAKYIFKYMQKNDTMIGGRYFLHGGSLAEPIYLYGETVEEFIDGEPTFTKDVQIAEHISYRELSFV